VEVFDFSLESLLSLGSFALAAELSSRNSCLAAMVIPELSWSDLCPTIAENDFDKRGKAREGFGGT
jgi:hypothetical protein